jgi:hypothetical protein
MHWFHQFHAHKKIHESFLGKQTIHTFNVETGQGLSLPWPFGQASSGVLSSVVGLIGRMGSWPNCPLATEIPARKEERYGRPPPTRRRTAERKRRNIRKSGSNKNKTVRIPSGKLT